jgi:hypothetical protein
MDELSPIISSNMDEKCVHEKKFIHEQWVKPWCQFEILFIDNKENFQRTIVWEIFGNLSSSHT